MASAAIGTKRAFASLEEENGGAADSYRSYSNSVARETTTADSTVLPQRRKVSPDGASS